MADDSDKHRERLKNLLLFKMYATDEEIGQAIPFLLVVAALILGAVWYWG